MISRREECNRTRVGAWLPGAAAFALLFAAGFGWHLSSGVASPSYPQYGKASGPRYLSPVALKLSPDGRRLYVVGQDGDEVLAVDTKSGEVAGRAKVGHKPKGIAISPDGKTLYVSNEWSGTVSELDADSLQVRRTLRAGWGPVGVTTDHAGKVLYVANTLGNDVSLIDLATGKEFKRLDAGKFPEYVALSQDGKRVMVSNLMARLGPFDEPPVSELTAIDTQKQLVANRILVPGVLHLRHIAEVPAKAGGFFLVPFMRPKNLNPLVQIEQGWYMTHGMAVVRLSASPATGAEDPQVSEVLLDDMDRYFADGFGAASTPDGRWALVTASGADVVSILDTSKLNRLLRQATAEDPEALANRLDAARQFVVRRLPTGHNPTAVEVSPDGRFAYVANRLDDTVSVVDMQQLKMASTIDLGGPKEISAVRHGERMFFTAGRSFQGQMACASCHPHGGLSDGLAWSLETPQLGRDVVENRTMLSIGDTSPFKWNGGNPDLATQDGPRTAMYIFRSEGFSSGEVKDLVTFIRSLQMPPNPRVGADGRLSDAAERGREIFFRTHTNYGSVIPLRDRCYFCHAPATNYTSRVRMDVGTATRYDTIKEFDIPSLDGVYMRAPYLHNGESLTLEEIWTKFNPEDKHGITSDMDKVQLNDLIEYLKTL